MNLGPQFYEKTPERAKKSEIWGGERKNSAKFLASHPSRAPPFGPPFFSGYGPPTFSDPPHLRQVQAKSGETWSRPKSVTFLGIFCAKIGPKAVRAKRRKNERAKSSLREIWGPPLFGLPTVQTSLGQKWYLPTTAVPV